MTVQELLEKLQRLLKDNRIVEDDVLYITTDIAAELTLVTKIIIPEGKVIII